MQAPQHALLTQGLALQWQGELDAAEQHYLAALAEAPAPSRLLLGRLALERNDLASAQTQLAQALVLDPGLSEAHYVLGLIYQVLAQPWQARDAFASYASARPRDPNGWSMLARAYRELQLSFHEVLCLERALDLKPDDLELLELRFSCWVALGQREGVRTYFERMLQLNPAGAEWFADQPASLRQQIAANRRMLQFQHLIFLFGDPDLSDAGLFDHVATLLPPEGQPLPPAPARQAGPLRLAYLSRELSAYSSASTLWPLLRHHSPAVELFAYNDTPVSYWGPATEALKPAFAHWRDVVGLDNHALAELIRADRIDVLIDMAGITDAGRHGLYAHRPAPVQIGGLGFGFSACHTAIDYAFGDPIRCPPEIAARYPEQVIPLTTTFHWEAAAEPDPGEPPSLRNGLITFGSSNTLNKLNPRVLALWCRILHELPTARLYLKTYAFSDVHTLAYWQSLFASRGIGPERLRLEGHAGRPHMAEYYPEIDIALDPFPYQGGVTTCEALWMGVPVVSLMHPDWRSRVVSANILATMGLKDWICSSEEAYLQQALAWARDLDFLREQRQTLRARLRHSAICDGPAAAAELEAVCQALRDQVNREG